MSHDWVSARAVAWVIHDAPVPADLAWTLTVIAACCDENGRGSYQSASTIAEKTGKSTSQVERDITRLRKLGLIIPGDQRLTEHLGGKRPVVYDLPLTMKGPKPVKQSKNPTGKKASDDAPSRIHAGGMGVEERTARMDAGGEGNKRRSADITEPDTPRMDARGGMDASSRMDAGPTSRMDAAPPPAWMRDKQPLNNPLNNLSLSAPEQQIVNAVEATPKEAREMISIIKTDNPRIGALPAYLATMAGNGTLALLRDRVRAGERAAVPRETPVPPPASVVFAQRRASATPPAERDEELTDREKAIAYARGRVGHSTPKARPTMSPERAEPAEAAAELAHGR